jgi:1-acyl-sn-glycerol-3-phosphate acyltransferase
MFSHQTTNLIAAGLLLILVAAGVLGVVRFMRRLNYSLPQLALFLINEFMCHFIWRATVTGRLKVADGQGAVIVSNHRSSFDPCFVQMVSNQRKVHWMVAAEYFSQPVMGTGLRITEAIPVGRRGIDTAATKQTMRYAAAGELVGMFPEGRINATDDILQSGRPGAVLVALTAGVPIIPCYIQGSPQAESVFANFVTRSRVRLTIGNPIDLSQYTGRGRDAKLLKQLTYEVMKEIARLGGQPDFEPTLAGRNWHPDHA